MSDQKGSTFEQVEKIASEMIIKGVKPSVRGVISVSGGKTETVSKHLRDFFDKRDAEVSKMADEIGSSNIAKLIANEIQVLVDKRTAELSEINIRQKEQIDELVELLEEKVQESQIIKKSADDDIEKANAKTEKAITAQKQAEDDKKELILKTDITIKSINDKADNSIKTAEEKANVLIESANEQVKQFEQETKSLREQVKQLSIDEAKREIEKAELEKQNQILEQLRIDFADQKTQLVQTMTENKSFLKDLSRLEKDNKENKKLSTELTKIQTQFVESQKQITELHSKLSLSERERESLSNALAISNK